MIRARHMEPSESAARTKFVNPEGFVIRALKYGVIVYAGLAMAFAALAHATVSLSFNQLAVTIDKLLASPPQATVALNLVSTAEQTTGLDYYLTALGSANGHFQVIDRNISTSLYNDLINPDQTSGEIRGVEALPEALLNPTTDLDLGGNATAAQASGTRFVSNYTIRVLPGTPNGSYVIETTSLDGTGWIGTDFMDHPFTNQASLNIIVVPEPACLGLAGMLGLLSLGRRKR